MEDMPRAGRGGWGLMRSTLKAYAERNGIDARVIPTPPRKLKLQAYADNFK